jgi:hypothetical protein
VDDPEYFRAIRAHALEAQREPLEEPANDPN